MRKTILTIMIAVLGMLSASAQNDLYRNVVNTRPDSLLKASKELKNELKIAQWKDKCVGATEFELSLGATRGFGYLYMGEDVRKSAVGYDVSVEVRANKNMSPWALGGRLGFIEIGYFHPWLPIKTPSKYDAIYLGPTFEFEYFRGSNFSPFVSACGGLGVGIDEETMTTYFVQPRIGVEIMRCFRVSCSLFSGKSLPGKGVITLNISAVLGGYKKNGISNSADAGK